MWVKILITIIHWCIPSCWSWKMIISSLLALKSCKLISPYTNGNVFFAIKQDSSSLKAKNIINMPCSFAFLCEIWSLYFDVSYYTALYVHKSLGETDSSEFPAKTVWSSFEAAIYNVFIFVLAKYQSYNYTVWYFERVKGHSTPHLIRFSKSNST